MKNKKEKIIEYLGNNYYDYHNDINNDNIEVIYNLLINNEKINYDDDIYFYYCGIKCTLSFRD